MANNENLRPVRTKSEARERGRVGGIKSGEARRKQKSLKAIADMLGGLEIKGEKNKQILRDFGVAEEDLVNDTISMYQLTLRAMKGDPKANETLAKIRKQLKDQTELEITEIKPLVDLTKRKKNGGEK